MTDKNTRTIRKNITAKKYDVIISLGADCLPALTFQTLGLADSYFPLDFLYRDQDKKTQLEEIDFLIQSDFKDFFNFDDLKLMDGGNDKITIYNNRTKFVFLHDLHKTPDGDYKQALQDQKDKYDRRIARFYDTVKKSKSVLFVYMEKNHVKHKNTEIFKKIWGTLHKKFPKVDVNCLFFVHDKRLDKNAYKEQYLNDNILLVKLNNGENLSLRPGDGWWRNENLFRDLFFKYCLLNKPHENNTKPKVSVLLPTYNSEKFLIQCVNSILNQTYQNFEILVVDDSSSDNTREILKSYKDKRIKIIDGPGKGLAAALNLGIKKAKGDYIARIDADDIAMPQRFEKQVAFLDEHPEFSIVGSWQEYFGNNNTFHKADSEWDKLKVSLIFRCNLCHSTLMLRKSDMIKHNLFYPEKSLQEDYELWCKAIEYIKISNIPEVLGMYRVTGNSITDSKRIALADYEANLTINNLKKYFGVTVDAEDIKLVSRRDYIYDKLSNKDKIIFENKLKNLYTKIERQNQKCKFVNPGYLRQELEYNWYCVCRGNTLTNSPYLPKLGNKELKIKLVLPIYYKNATNERIIYKLFGLRVLKIKKYQNSTKRKYYVLGIPILKI